jgi:hypothetical protein
MSKERDLMIETRFLIPVAGYVLFMAEEWRKNPHTKSIAPLIVTGIALALFLILAALRILLPLWWSATLLFVLTVCTATLFTFATRIDLWLYARHRPGGIEGAIGWNQMSKFTEEKKRKVFRIVNYQEAWIFAVAAIIGFLAGPLFAS